MEVAAESGPKVIEEAISNVTGRIAAEERDGPVKRASHLACSVIACCALSPLAAQSARAGLLACMRMIASPNTFELECPQLWLKVRYRTDYQFARLQRRKDKIRKERKRKKERKERKGKERKK
eukprot:scaffold212028_cov35-Prasinocladus_malaysianus.AAC.1